MKNLIIYTGIALVVLTNIDNTSFDAKKEGKTSQESRKEMVVAKGFKTELSNSKKLLTPNNATALNSRTLFLSNFPKLTENKTIGREEPIEVLSINKLNKTADELIAEDNAITENNISNETQALDFDAINGNTIGYEVFEQVNSSKTEKTADQLIAEDNAITENNISNETQALDFDVINGNKMGYEVAEQENGSETEKTADQLIAEDNLITENNISNETQALDFNIINGNEKVEFVNTFKIEKTADQLIAEDNAITENNISNETQALDFRIINKISKLRN